MEHHYRATVQWTGNLGTGTRDYRGYSRSHVITSPGKPEVRGTSDIAPGGDPSHYSPEELLLGALSACHMLWYLHLCVDHAVGVVEYSDDAEGWMTTDGSGGGSFSRALLHPRVTIATGELRTARQLHEQAHRKCFIANSVKFPVECDPQVVATDLPD